MPELVNGSSKNMLAHALWSLLVFKHGFVLMSFGIFDFIFIFALWVTNTIKFYKIAFLGKHIFFIDEKCTKWNLNTMVKVFHESISCFMKWPWNCVSWNALKEKFHSVSLPWYSFFCLLIQRVSWLLQSFYPLHLLYETGETKLL